MQKSPVESPKHHLHNKNALHPHKTSTNTKGKGKQVSDHHVQVKKSETNTKKVKKCL